MKKNVLKFSSWHKLNEQSNNLNINSKDDVYNYIQNGRYSGDVSDIRSEGSYIFIEMSHRIGYGYSDIELSKDLDSNGLIGFCDVRYDDQDEESFTVSGQISTAQNIKSGEDLDNFINACINTGITKYKGSDPVQLNEIYPIEISNVSIEHDNW